MVKNEEKTMVIGKVVVGMIAGWMITIIGAAIATTLIQKETIKQSDVSMITAMIVLMGSWSSSLICANRYPEKRLLMNLCGGSMYYLSLMCVAIVMFDGLKGGILATFMVSVAGALTAFLLSAHSKHKQKYRIPNYRK